MTRPPPRIIGSGPVRVRPTGTVVASAIKLTTTPLLARSLNSALGVNTFKGGQNFGIMTLTIAVERQRPR